MKRQTRHTLGWSAGIIAAAVLLFFSFVPIAKWLIVGNTLALYEETADRYSTDGEQAPAFQGTITDTLFRPSAVKKGQVDTIIHRQRIQLAQEETKSDHKPKREDVGTFGDGGGLVNAFFSFLAFLAVVITMYMQSRKDSQDKQNGARMQFEQEFFAMVEMLENIVSHLRFTDYKPVEDAKLINDIVSQFYKNTGTEDDDEEELPKPVVVEGRDVFKYIYVDRENYNLIKYVESQKDLRMTTEAQEMCFDGTLDHYFRYFYRILKHIDESKLLDQLDDPDKERTYYAHLLRAQLSNYELKMLFYNGLLGENPQTIKKLIERYAMFNNLRAWELGKYQKAYYQAILDEEIIEDPDDFDAETTYSVTAFWDEKKLKEFRKRATQDENRKRDVCQWVKKCWPKKGAAIHERDVANEAEMPAVESPKEATPVAVKPTMVRNDATPSKKEEKNTSTPQRKESEESSKKTGKQPKRPDNLQELLDRRGNKGSNKTKKKKK